MKENDVVVAVTKESEIQSVYSDQIRTHIKIPLSLYKKFVNYLQVKCSWDESEMEKIEPYEIETAFELGLLQLQNEIGKQTTLIYYDGRPPRGDVYVNLAKIAKEFLKCNTYPNIPAGAIIPIIHKAIGTKDLRIFKKYRKTVLNYCNIPEDVVERCTNDNKLGILNVLNFVSRIPKKFMLEEFHE